CPPIKCNRHTEMMPTMKNDTQNMAVPARRGVVLIIVLIVIALLTLSAYTFSDMMYSEHAGAQAHGDRAQSQALAESGVAAAQAFLLLPPESRAQFGGTYDNPTLFQNRLITSPTTFDELTGYYC